LLSQAESDRLIVVLVRPRNPLNIGAAARAMGNFGLRNLRVVSPFELAFREARSAVSARSVLARAEEYKDLAEAVADCALVVGTTAARHRQLQQPLRRLDEQGASLIRQRLRSDRVALLFGSEKTGLGNDDLDHCHWLLRIPTYERHISMNLGQAVAVCLYELAKQCTSAAKIKPQPAATAAEAERITGVLFDTLRACGYVTPGSDTSAAARVRRLVRRMNLQPADAELWLGMLRQILWKLTRNP
jgi:tRNA/rRNA methyltransferase